MDSIFSMSAQKIKNFALIFFFCLCLSPCYPQEMSSGELKLMTILNSGANSIPEDLQLSKTIVVISIDNKDEVRNDWKILAEEAHFYFKKLSIDAVLYFTLTN